MNSLDLQKEVINRDNPDLLASSHLGTEQPCEFIILKKKEERETVHVGRAIITLKS